MEKYPNPLTNVDSSMWRNWESEPIAPANETPVEAQARKRAFKQWYAARRRFMKEQYHRWVFRRSKEQHQGATTFDVMGRWAIQQALALETNQGVRKQRQFALTKEWQRFVKRAFRKGRP